MELMINGDKLEVPNTIKTIYNLLQHFELEKKVIIIELNATILEKELHQGTLLSDGDRIELVHFVGGG